MNFLIQLAILVVTSLIAYALAPKPPKPKPPSLEDFEVPTAEAGRAIPVVFGEVTVTGPNCVWYGDLEVQTETEDGIKRRFYYLGLHFAVCYGPVDHLSRILYGNKVAWGEGSSAFGIVPEDPITESQEIIIFAGNLHGGEDREGGLAGYFDIAFGDADQGSNSYLTTQLGSPQPAYRGVLSVIGKHAYVGTSQYVKPFAFSVRRIEQGWYNDSCWYPETAAVGDTDGGTGSTLLSMTFQDYVYSPETPLAAATTPVTRILSGLWAGDVLAGSLDYTVSGGYVSAVDPIVGNASYVAWSTSGLILNNTANSIDVSHSDYLSMFFPDRVGRITITFRIDTMPTGVGTYAHLISCGRNENTAATGSWSWFIRVGSNGQLVFAFLESNGSTVSSVGSTTTIVEDEIYTAEVRITDALIELYINGSKESELENSADFYQITTPLQPARIILGTLNAYGIFYLEGRIGYLEIHVGAEPSAYDMNPAHIIYEAITNPDWGMGYPASVIDDTNFRAAADTFYTEGMGLSMQWLRQETIEDFIRIILDHCGAVLVVDQTTGKFQIKPLRADYTVASLPEFDETNIVVVEEFERAGYGELVGEVTVVYRDKAQNTDQGVTVHNLAVIQSQSGTTSDTTQYPGISRHSLAARVAERDLDGKSVPLARGKIRVNREAWDLAPADVFKLTWSKLGLTSVVCRVVEIDYGTLTDGAIVITFVEDVFGLPSSSYAAEQTTLWSDPVATESEDATFRVDESGDDRITQAQQYRYTEGT